MGPFQTVVEATATYEWLWQLLEPLAQRLVLAHPTKLGIIAESTRKSKELDACVLADFLALGMIPESYRPTLWQRPHRTLVLQRHFLGRQITAPKNRIRYLVGHYNADRPDNAIEHQSFRLFQSCQLPSIPRHRHSSSLIPCSDSG